MPSENAVFHHTLPMRTGHDVILEGDDALHLLRARRSEATRSALTQLGEKGAVIEALLEVAEDLERQSGRLAQQQASADTHADPGVARVMDAGLVEGQSAVCRRADVLAETLAQARIDAVEQLRQAGDALAAQAIDGHLDQAHKAVAKLSRKGPGAINAQMASDAHRFEQRFSGANEMPLEPTPTACAVVDADGEPDMQAALPSGVKTAMAPIVKTMSRIASRRANKQIGQHDQETDSQTAGLQTDWAQTLGDHPEVRAQDPNSLVQWAMRQAYVDSTEDMRNYAVKLNYYSNLRRAMREELQRARDFRSAHPQADSEDGLHFRKAYTLKTFDQEPYIDGHGVWHVREEKQTTTTTDIGEMDAYMKNLESRMQSVGEDAQLAQIELQYMTQRQQQMINALSSLSKAMHETSMSILRKIGS